MLQLISLCWRLNRMEYENTIADLFDVHGNFAAGFPRICANTVLTTTAGR
ncbi:MAG: DUF1587 domain-containing protein [Planctomycetaceae bacterium]|nr:DUF1587 domain-containing protein [Planctomycetaceae bacterium]